MIESKSLSTVQIIVPAATACLLDKIAAELRDFYVETGIGQPGGQPGPSAAPGAPIRGAGRRECLDGGIAALWLGLDLAW